MGNSNKYGIEWILFGKFVYLKLETIFSLNTEGTDKFLTKTFDFVFEDTYDT